MVSPLLPNSSCEVVYHRRPTDARCLRCPRLSDLPGTLVAMTTSRDYDWPGPTVLGQTSTGDLVFLSEAYAVAAASELDKWRAASTWGQARDLANRAQCLAPPFAVEDLEAAQDDDASFDVTELGVVADGDWPPMPGALSLELVHRDSPGRGTFEVGAVVDTVFNGPLLQISADQEEALCGALEAAGCTVRRDDDLVRRAGEV